MANNENLKPFPKGTSGHPGRVSPNRATLLKKYLKATILTDNPLADLDPDDPAAPPELKKMKAMDRVILALIAKAIKGDVKAIQEIQNTLHGKIPDKVEVEKHESKVTFYIPDNGRQ